MKYTAVIFFLLVATLVYSMGDSVSNATPMKTEFIEPWADSTIKLIVPGSSGPPATKCKTETTTVRRAVYQVVPKPDPGSLIPERFSILEVDDPHTKKWWFIDGEHSFYVSDRSGMKGFTVGPGVLVWSSSYFGLPDTNSSTTAIAQFEKEINTEKLSHEFNQRITANRIQLMQSLPQFYFSDAPAPGGGLVMPLVEAIDLTDGILRLDIRHPKTQKLGSIWMDLTAKKVSRSVVDGQEMDLNTGKPFAVPLKTP
ncbi:MAG TPA: hypothetical protein VMP11_09665 [Verrucomicrobiae bacterium]|nr:hypothetical protein [Verrucomicrobiae bacterium]